MRDMNLGGASTQYEGGLAPIVCNKSQPREETESMPGNFSAPPASTACFATTPTMFYGQVSARRCRKTPFIFRDRTATLGMDPMMQVDS
jgi:hypothetical protein